MTSPEARPRAVVFDLDGVLYQLHPEIRAEVLARYTGLAPVDIAAVFRSEFEARAESGFYADGAAYLSGFNEALGARLTREQWIEARRMAMQPQPDVVALAIELSGVMPVGILTNNGALLRDALADLIGPLWESLGPRCWVSCELGARKPEARAFEQVVQRLGLAPSAVLFVDDSAANCEGARAAGLEALHFQDAATTVAAVRRLVLAGR